MWYEESHKGLVLHLKVVPKASKTEITGLQGDPPRLKIRLSAPPVDGRANEELLKFLSKTLKISRTQISLLRGDKSPKKDVFLLGVSIEKIKSLVQTDGQLELSAPSED